MKIKKARRTWTQQNVDSQLQILIENGAVSPVAWWLMASYAYYVLNKPFLKDQTFDWLGHWMKDNWTAIKHPNKRLIKRDGTFTGYYVKNYPTRVKCATWQLLKILKLGD